MSRREFSKETKRAAWERSGGICEAQGAWYGLEPGQRCCTSLTVKGAEYDHVDQDANSKDNSLENCAAVCKPCHHFKTTKIDTPKAAKTVRQQDAHRGIRSRGARLPTKADRERIRARQAERENRRNA